MTPAEQARLDQNKAAVDEELDDLIESWRFLRERHDSVTTLLCMSQVLHDSEPSHDDLMRLLTYAVGRLAEGGAS
jgi:hypothetical protein